MKKNKYSSIYKEVPSGKKSIAEKLITDLLFFDETLETLRSFVSENGVVELFEQGTQKFTRESPALKSFNQTQKQRNATYTQLLALIPKQEAKPASDGFDEFICEREDM